MKKWMYLVIACLSITLIGYSVMAYAHETPANASKEVKGIFVALDSQNNIQIQTTNGTETIALAKSVWVYRNQQKANLTDLKAKDQLDLILNGKLQAAYIKAKSPDAAAGTAPSPTPEPTMAVSPTPEPTATATPTPVVTATPVPATPAPTTGVISKTQAQITVTLNQPKQDENNDDNDHNDDKKQDDNKRGKANKKSNDHGDNHGHRSGDD
jgi:type IV secretory pathway VirJ component